MRERYTVRTSQLGELALAQRRWDPMVPVWWAISKHGELQIFRYHYSYTYVPVVARACVGAHNKRELSLALACASDNVDLAVIESEVAGERGVASTALIPTKPSLPRLQKICE